MSSKLPAEVIYSGYTSVGTSAVLIIPDSDVIAVKVKFGILIRCPAANTNTVFISNNPGVTNTNSVSGGFPFDPGSQLFIPYKNPWLLYAVSGGTGQHLKYMVL